ncbi:molybdopterin oxidoreductase family protein [Nocardia jinanensis]|uniref:Oxidoreductase n=1 Tax=Nocardia jinanensis TaxID=382504 RepID=A0A917R7S6_9NOCA|nr:molybdopterin oxidoreductase family protein [Nocardia jinanensis]GGK93500.1 oxidoreductase [Nocardia jinanensis]
MTAETIARQCTLCEAHCGILVTVEDTKVAKIEGNPDDVLSKGYICPKATAMAGLHEDPDRLRTPMRRVGDTFEPIGWDEAFREIGTRLRRVRRDHGPHSVGMYLGNPAAHNSAIMYAFALRTALMTRNFYTASSIDQFPQEFVAWQMYGSNFLMPIADIDRTHRMVIIGANPAVSNGSVTTMPGARNRIKEVRARGGKVVVIDPRRTETARLADEHVSVLPGGDPYLLLAVLHVLITEDLCDRTAVRTQCTGLDELRELVTGFTPEDAAPYAGVDAETIRRLAREHAAAKSAVMYARIGVCQTLTGTVTHWLVNTINAITGNLDHPGGQMYATPAVDLLPLARRMPPYYGAWTDRSGKYKSFRFELPVAALASEILDEGPDKIRAMITYAGNPVLSTPQRGQLDKALGSLDFYVAVDMYITETTRHADIILPPLSPLEREDLDILLTMFSVHNNVRFNTRAVAPENDGLEDWEIMARLTTEILPLPLRSLSGRALNAVFARFSPLRAAALGMAVGPHGVLRRGRQGVTLKKVREARGGIDLGPLQPRLHSLIATADRLVQLAPRQFVIEARRLLDEAHAGGADRDQGFDLRLIGRRHLRSNNSWLHNVPSMVKGRDRCTALMHPQDADARGLADGGRVTVSSPIGSIVVPVEISDEIRPGTVAIPHGWGHGEPGVGWTVAAAVPGANVNLLHDPEQVDRISGNAAVNSTWVKVHAV